MDVEKYMSIVSKVLIRRSKKPVEFKEAVVTWILDHTRQSSNTKNIVKWKDDKMKMEHIVHWREETITKMFQTCKMDIKHGDSLRRSYFYHCIPEFVRLVKKQEGLCPYHMSAHHWYRELQRVRQKWHKRAKKNCICTCSFCSSTGCKHGSNPLNGKCEELTCERCENIKCPVEWNETHATVWYTSSLEKRSGGGMHWVDTEHKGTRAKMMRNWKKELKAFHEHDARVDWMRNKILWLKNNLPFGHILIKGDFIQNITHTRGAESSSGYYNQRQTQLLVFVIWYHTQHSTPDKPIVAKMYVDYLSGYLKHTSLFFQKGFTHLMQHLTDTLHHPIQKVCNLH